MGLRHPVYINIPTHCNTLQHIETSSSFVNMVNELDVSMCCSVLQCVGMFLCVAVCYKCVAIREYT